ncbi:PLP-dependent aminotransferase family protein [Tardiphaga sp.]|uniref:PLP-dependent aminotransferase family protein n=1 Tax=Tardiphaga sp. TaxID=1926292 RepID=UPI0037D9A916
MTIAINPFIAAIPTNPLRALFPYGARPGMLNLASGHPSKDAYDLEGLAEAASRASRDFSAWTYGSSAGDPALIGALAETVTTLPPGKRLLVTSGAQQGIDLAIRTFAEPGSKVMVPEPVYPAVLSTCAAIGVVPVGYQIAAGDNELAEFETVLQTAGDVRAIYALPTFGNPTGETLTREQRLRLLGLCARHGVPVIEDAPYSDLWFRAPPPPSLLDLAPQVDGATVIHLGSLSKIMSPGLRIGWLIAPESVAAAMQEARQASDLQPNALAQRVAWHYLQLGRLIDHVARVRGLYAERHDALVAVLTRAGFTVPVVDGGMFIFPVLPADKGNSDLFERAVVQDVLFAPGPAFRAQPDSGLFADRMRLCFAGLAKADIVVAAERLAAAVHA